MAARETTFVKSTVANRILVANTRRIEVALGAGHVSLGRLPY